MKVFAFAFVLAVCSVGFGQAGNSEFKKPTVKVVKSTAAPVTKSEAKKTFDKVWLALTDGLSIKGKNPVKLQVVPGTVTRNEVVQAIQVLVSSTESFYKRSPKKAVYDRNRIRTDFDQSKFGKLIDEGFISPYGPLTTGKVDQLTTKQFGEAVGQVLVRVADLCHLPSRKFSPFLKSQP